MNFLFLLLRQMFHLRMWHFDCIPVVIFCSDEMVAFVSHISGIQLRAPYNFASIPLCYDTILVNGILMSKIYLWIHGFSYCCLPLSHNSRYGLLWNIILFGVIFSMLTSDGLYYTVFQEVPCCICRCCFKSIPCAR